MTLPLGLYRFTEFDCELNCGRAAIVATPIPHRERHPTPPSQY
jgi:hypothetical protein